MPVAVRDLSPAHAHRLLPWAATAGRLLLGGVWVAAGALKLPDPAASVRAVRAYRLLPEGLVPTVAYGLPVLEIGLGALLILGLAVRLAAGLSAVLLLVFLAGLASAWARGLQIDCGCFGGGEVAAGATRALNAAACVAADAGVAAFQRFHALLYADQPAEGSAGLPDSRLVSLGAQAGANASTLGTCVRDLTYQAWTRQVTDIASRHGVNATPTVLVNGQRLAVPTPANLQAAVRAAGG